MIGVKYKTIWPHVCGKTKYAKRHCYVKSVYGFEHTST